MIKVLIVDDEPKLREGLRTFIDWFAHGYIVVDTAANGNEALEKYKIYRPDLVIADIRMPGMDGLQLIQQLRVLDPMLHVLILSGYADFDYAKKAITHRTDGYLLKPVDEEELIDYLQKIKQQISDEKIAELWQHTTREWGREVFIRSLLNENEEEKPTLDKAEELGLLWKSYQVLLINLHMEDDSDTEITARMRKKAVELFEQIGRGYVFSYHTQIGILLKTPILGVEMEETYNKIREAGIGAGVDFTAALGPKVFNLEEVCRSYAAARELNKNHFFHGNGKLLSLETVQEGQATKESGEWPTEPLHEQLYYTVEVGNRETMRSLVRRTGQSLVSDGLSEGEIKRRFVEMLASILGKGLQQSPELQSRSKEFSDYLSEIHKVWTLEGVYEKTEFFLEQMMSGLGEGGKHREVKIMLDLIHRNFSDNLKLETLSGIFNYNSAYLGKLFKNATGEYFNTYLDKVRIEKAKSLLEEGLKVYQVAEKVGYTNVDYFHSKFRKYVGTSPSAYRKTANHA
ncbi:two-component system response regulator YesN [Fontibacillus phaseoli]|uniref:Two-component system response regulator YesN n=1 Tax=Fontibacillus phaseoli TaxID=1416533 RepID=A0A369BSR6_9BACL|nr:response regulator transcription factor [Fontibacillus phaseoli]RCX22644.1 two-component system response regulator YesN [Fontibacillus phaseoli]